MLLTNLRAGGSFPNQTRLPVCRSKTGKSLSQLSVAANVGGLAAGADEGGVTLAHKYSALGVVAVAHSILVGHRAAAVANAEHEQVARRTGRREGMPGVCCLKFFQLVSDLLLGQSRHVRAVYLKD